MKVAPGKRSQHTSSTSYRRDRGAEFLKVNCAALPGELLESELFGYERGAFTGATRTKPGKFELCDKGTILLDEVAEMPANLQAKLLHVLQDKRFFRLGGENTIEVDVRILAATNVNVHQAIAERKFREDLYYRLSAFTITCHRSGSGRRKSPCYFGISWAGWLPSTPVPPSGSRQLLSRRVCAIRGRAT